MPVPVSLIDTTIYSPGDSSGGAVIRPAVLQTDVQDTAFGHGVAGIDGQVQDCELELVRVDPSWCKIGFCIDRKPNPGTQRATQQIFDTDNQAIEVDGSRVELLLTRKGEQALD
jgi:hypothetical protein